MRGRADEQGRESGRGTGRRDDVLDVLRRAAGPLPIAQIAEELEVHPNTVRFHLESLTRTGQVERVRSQHRTPGRPPQLFRAVRGMDPAGTRQFRMLAEILVDSVGDDPQARGRAIRAGQAWGRRGATEPPDAGGGEAAEPVGRLAGLLDTLGFAPERTAQAEQLPEDPEIRLRNCPFLDLARSRPQVVCPIHLGIMQGAMDAWGAPVTVDRLDPFVEPDLCVVHLTRTATQRSGGDTS